MIISFWEFKIMDYESQALEKIKKKWVAMLFLIKECLAHNFYMRNYQAK